MVSIRTDEYIESLPAQGAKLAGPSEPKAKPGDDGLARSSDFIDFIYENPTEFHATNYLAKLLKTYNFEYLAEREEWSDRIKSGGKYYTTRNGSSLVAFEVGKDWVPGNGIGVVGCHIDANCLKLKPFSKKEFKDGFQLLGAASYADGMNETWWDRDLSVGGRIIVRSKDKLGNDSVASKLVYIKTPIAMIPTLAPHFGEPSKGPHNKETRMIPIIGLEGGDDDEEEGEPTESEQKSPMFGKHDISLLRAVAKNANANVEDILQMELELFNAQRGVIGGLKKQLLFCPRLDDKLCSYAAIYGLIKSSGSSPNTVNAVALFDNEEVGSLTKQGAKGHLFESVVERINCAFKGTDDMKSLIYSNSFFVSSDVTHAVNPNFSDIYLEHHKPKLNHGMTIKLDPNVHTTSDGLSTALVEEIAKRTNNKLQYFHIRNDSRSGGTIGPALSASTGMRAVDMGIPQLSMHSIRATTGSKDVSLGISMFKSFFEKWAEVDAEFKKGDL